MNQPPAVSPPITRLNDNGAWCWFQNERAILHDGKVLIGSIADDSGADGATRKGDVDLTVWDLRSGGVKRTVLHAGLEDDDHDAPALYVRQDGRLLVLYGKHSTDHLMRWRIAETAGDYEHFGPEQTLDAGAGYTYQNIYRLSAEHGRLYNFHRGFGFNPNFMVSDDDGTTWRYGGRLLKWLRPTASDPKFTGLDGGRPYVRYVSNGVDTVHFITTEDHPRAYDNSVYHGYMRAGQLFGSRGNLIAKVSDNRNVAPQPNEFTPIARGSRDFVAWTTDIRLDAAGLPYMTYTEQVFGGDQRTDPKAGGDNIQHGYARFDGTSWRGGHLAFGGSALYSPEVDYSGLTALHPYDPNTVYLSTNADPKTGEPLISTADGKRHHEIFRGRLDTADERWTWTPLTANSTCDNLRPIVPPGDPTQTVVLWFRGTYRTFTDYSTEVVGIVDQP